MSRVALRVATGRVELDHDRVAALAMRLGDAVADVAGHDLVDDAARRAGRRPASPRPGRATCPARRSARPNPTERAREGCSPDRAPRRFMCLSLIIRRSAESRTAARSTSRACRRLRRPRRSSRRRPRACRVSRIATGRPAASAANTSPRWTAPTALSSSFRTPIGSNSGSKSASISSAHSRRRPPITSPSSGLTWPPTPIV